MPVYARYAPRLALLVAMLLAFAPLAHAQSPAVPFPEGSSEVRVDFNGTELDLWIFKPDNYVGDGFILLLHGASRAAEEYRDNARNFARRHGRLVVVPEFDSERFPNWRYQMGGVFRPDGTFVDPAEHTYATIPLISEYVRVREGNSRMPWLLLGYSAGAQFVSRMAAFYDLDAERLIAMAPGSTLFPSRELEFGLGFGRLPAAHATDERIQRYLALPLTIAIGTADVEEGQLPTGAAFQQGAHRYARNLRWFLTAMELAHERGWEFGWRLVLHHGAGHPPVQMFDHPAMTNSLFGHRLEP